MRLLTFSKVILKEKGASYIEFALTVPVLLIFLGGIIALGQVFAQITWVAQTAYQTAMLGAGTPRDGSEDAIITGKAQEIYTLHTDPNFGLIKKEPVDPATWSSTFAHTYENGPDTNRPMIRVALAPTVFSLPLSLFSSDLGFRMEVVVPMLIGDGSGAGNLNQFMDPPDNYNCNGQATNSPPGICRFQLPPYLGGVATPRSKY